ncbi:hypothetical protein D9619_011907 [Psilocybe cf. subviscida]|uniref:Bola-like protein n=1 Tax=Psilocybe cf. subviscida TaxID=2480587 RepID=A0A8H5B0I1_9AGAR|nr:hypothetical protein D9619_011907 [Psilocybe cf. subviscida]
MHLIRSDIVLTSLISGTQAKPSKAFPVPKQFPSTAMPIDMIAFEKAIKRAIPVTHLEIEDQSSGCGDNYAIVLVSEAFQGKTTLARHRMVNELLKDQIAQMHAFSQKTYTPSQYDALQNKSSQT